MTLASEQVTTTAKGSCQCPEVLSLIEDETSPLLMPVSTYFSFPFLSFSNALSADIVILFVIFTSIRQKCPGFIRARIRSDLNRAEILFRLIISLILTHYNEHQPYTIRILEVD